MKKTLLTLLLATAGITLQSVAAESPMKKEFDAAKTRAETTYTAARAACNGQSGSGKALCMEEAKAAQKRSKAEALAAYVDTPKARVNARKEIADADFDVAREKCKALKGNARDVCLTEAKSNHTTMIADANADGKVTAARNEANDEKRNAEYKVEREKCDAMTGSVKSTCIDLAKAKYGK